MQVSPWLKHMHYVFLEGREHFLSISVVFVLYRCLLLAPVFFFFFFFVTLLHGSQNQTGLTSKSSAQWAFWSPHQICLPVPYCLCWLFPSLHYFSVSSYHQIKGDFRSFQPTTAFEPTWTDFESPGLKPKDTCCPGVDAWNVMLIILHFIF